MSFAAYGVALQLINKIPLDYKEWILVLYKEETFRPILFLYESKEMFFSMNMTTIIPRGILYFLM